MKYVQIVDDKVISVFCCPQNPENWPGYTEVSDEDPRYVAYINWLKNIIQ